MGYVYLLTNMPLAPGLRMVQQSQLIHLLWRRETRLSLNVVGGVKVLP
jgi:hypothetical protein